MRRWIFGAIALLLSFSLVGFSIGVIQLDAHVKQVNLPLGDCVFNETTWQVHTDGIMSSMTSDIQANVNGEMISVRARYPAPPSLLHLKTRSQVANKQVEWQNVIVTCRVDPKREQAFPEPIPLELILPVFCPAALILLVFVLYLVSFCSRADCVIFGSACSIIGLIISAVQLCAYNQQIHLPVGDCLFNGTRWEIDNGGLTSTMTAHAMVFLKGETIPIQVHYPAPPYLLNLKRTSVLFQRQKEWENGMVSCFVNTGKGQAYPESIQMSLIWPVFVPSLVYLYVLFSVEEAKKLRRAHEMGLG